MPDFVDKLTITIQKCLKGTGDQRRIQAPTQAIFRKLYEIVFQVRRHNYEKTPISVVNGWKFDLE